MKDFKLITLGIVNYTAKLQDSIYVISFFWANCYVGKHERSEYNKGLPYVNVLSNSSIGWPGILEYRFFVYITWVRDAGYNWTASNETLLTTSTYAEKIVASFIFTVENWYTSLRNEIFSPSTIQSHMHHAVWATSHFSLLQTPCKHCLFYGVQCYVQY